MPTDVVPTSHVQGRLSPRGVINMSVATVSGISPVGPPVQRISLPQLFAFGGAVDGCLVCGGSRLPPYSETLDILPWRTRLQKWRGIS